MVNPEKRHNRVTAHSFRQANRQQYSQDKSILTGILDNASQSRRKSSIIDLKAVARVFRPWTGPKREPSCNIVTPRLPKQLAIGWEVQVMERKLTILVVDSHPIVRWALREFLVNRPNVELVMEADCVTQAVSMMKTRNPDVVITELIFPDSEGLDAVQELIKSTTAGIIAFSDQDAWDQVEQFLNLGGMGFVTKRSALPELATAIKAVAGKQKWIAPSVRSAVPSRRIISNGKSCDLTDREREIVALITKGFTSKQIADQLCLSIKTVETHRYRVFKKLNIKHCAQLADYAIRHGISRKPRRPSSDKLN